MKLNHLRRRLLVDGLKRLLVDIRGWAALREDADTAHRADLAKKVELARGKLADLRRIQRREREIQKRRHEIERENAARN